MLRRAVGFNGVILCVRDSAVDVIGVVQENFPTGSAPEGVVRLAKVVIEKFGSAGFLKVGDHLFGKVLVLANHQMNVVRHDGAGVAGVDLRSDYVRYSCRNQCDVTWRKLNQIKFQFVRSGRVEVPDGL